MPDTPRLLGGRYELGPVLGRGGMADVRRAHDTVLGRDVAIKVLRAGDDVDRSRFDAEARLLARMSHENVVTVLDAGVEQIDDGSAGDGVEEAWLALELVEGDTLADRYKAGPLDPQDVARTGAQVAAALAHAHGHGVVHRDVKPSNVLLADDRARLTDFGIARLVDDEAALTMTGTAVGTAAYIAPEQVTGGSVTTASDVYALGLLLLEGLTGRREFPGPAVEAALARLQRGPLIPTSLPAGWPGLLAAMTAREPAERPSAAQVRDRLRTLAAAPLAPPADPSRTEVLPTATAVLPAVPAAGPPVAPAVAPITPAAVGAVAAGAVAGGAAGAALGPPPPPPSWRRSASPDDSRRRRRGVLAVLGGVAAVVAFVIALSAVTLGGAPGDDGTPVSDPSPSTSAPSDSSSVRPASRTSSATSEPSTEPSTEPTTEPTTTATTPAQTQQQPQQPQQPQAPAGPGKGKGDKKDKGPGKGKGKP